MKRLIMIGLLISGAWAADFSHMSTEEMMNMRGSVPVEDRPDFRQEMQKRMQNMSPEERQKYKGMRQGNCIKGQGTGKNCCMSKQQPTFAEYDLNNDGKITPEELNEARAKRMSQKAKEGKMLRNAGNAPAFADMDKNKDGSLNKEEFRLHQTEQIKKYNKSNCPTENCPSTGMGQGQGIKRNAPTFADIDTNNDGVISQEEFRVHQTQRMKNKGNCTSGNCP
ncbi:MAG: EF-hand domain-containing protein [Sulfurovum sp.]